MSIEGRQRHRAPSRRFEVDAGAMQNKSHRHDWETCKRGSIPVETKPTEMAFVEMVDVARSNPDRAAQVAPVTNVSMRESSFRPFTPSRFKRSERSCGTKKKSQ